MEKYLYSWFLSQLSLASILHKKMFNKKVWFSKKHTNKKQTKNKKRKQVWFKWIPNYLMKIMPISAISQWDYESLHFSSVQSLSCVWLFATPWIKARQASLSITNSQNLLKPMSIESVMPSNHLILCCPLLLLPPIPPSIRVFSNESTLHRGGQSIGVSASASVLPMNTQDWSPSGWTGWISLQSKGLSRVFSNATVQSINFLVLSFLHSPTLTSIHDHWKNHSLD